MMYEVEEPKRRQPIRHRTHPSDVPIAPTATTVASKIRQDFQPQSDVDNAIVIVLIVTDPHEQ
jgi:hypothetical protein